MYYICTVLRTYKYRLFPSLEQEVLINKHIGACRFVYNLALEVKNYAYATQRKNITCFDLIKQLPDLRKECIWLKEVDSQSLQQSVINLDKAFTQFFKGNSAFPKFKKKNASRSFRNPHGNKVNFLDGKLYQPKFNDGIDVIMHRPLKGEIKSTTISRTPTNKYFVSVLVDTNEKETIKKPITESTSIGIDLGVKDLIVASNGLKINNPKHLSKSLTKLKYLSKKASKKKKGSSNQKKAFKKIALLHESISNKRRDFLHKTSSQLIKNHDTLCFETLQINNMLKNRKLARSISDSGWRLFLEMCRYKSEWAGNNIIQIPTFEPSTKLCSVCGHTNHALTLNDREWVCDNCNTFHDRDINAAINIKKYSLKNCGGVSRGKPVELPTLVGAMKQEKKN